MSKRVVLNVLVMASRVSIKDTYVFIRLYNFQFNIMSVQHLNDTKKRKLIKWELILYISLLI